MVAVRRLSFLCVADHSAVLFLPLPFSSPRHCGPFRWHPLSALSLHSALCSCHRCRHRSSHSAFRSLRPSTDGLPRLHSAPLLTNCVVCALSLLVVILCSPLRTSLAPPPAPRPAMSRPPLPHARDADTADATAPLSHAGEAKANSSAAAVCVEVAAATADETGDAALLWSFLCKSVGKTNENASAETAPLNDAQTIGGDRLPAHTPSPVTRLYRHALESILGMLPLDDLSRVLAVSRAWSAAVRSMTPIAALLFRDHRHPFPIALLVGSPLLRHLAAIHRKHSSQATMPMDNASITLLSLHAPNLTAVQCALTFLPTRPLALPAQLQSLELEMDAEYSDAAINSLLATVAALPSLTSFHLKLSIFGLKNSIQLRLLAACHSLTDLTLETLLSFTPTLTDSQVEQVRENLGHLQHLLPKDGIARGRASAAAARHGALERHRTCQC